MEFLVCFILNYNQKIFIAFILNYKIRETMSISFFRSIA